MPDDKSINLTPTEDKPQDKPDIKPSDNQDDLKATIDSLNATLSEINERVATVEEKVTAQPTTTEDDKGQPGWKPASWDDIPKKAEEIAQQTIDKAFADREAAAKEAQQAEQDKLKAIDNEFNDQLGQLEKQGKIPAVKNAEDENDPGRLARKELFGLGVHYDSPNLLKMAELRETYAKQGYKYDVKARKLIRSNTPPELSQNAPVAGGSSGALNTDNRPTYKELHSKSMDQLVSEFNRQ